MTAEKIKIASNDSKISDEKQNITLTVEIMENILSLYKKEGINLSDEEINLLIQSSFGEATVNKIAALRSEKLSKREQLEEHIYWVDGINTFSKLYPGLRMLVLSGYVYCKNGEIKIIENAFEEIEERNTYFITDKKELELYKRHVKIAEDLNKLSEDMSKATGATVITSWLLKYNPDGIASPSDVFRYGK